MTRLEVGVERSILPRNSKMRLKKVKRAHDFSGLDTFVEVKSNSSER